MWESIKRDWVWYVGIFVSLIVLQMIAGCNTPKFVKDVGFVSSATANSPEFPVMIKGSVCRDNSGQPGLCAIRQKAEEDFVVDILPQPYDYTATWNCSMNVPGPWPQAYQVLHDMPLQVRVKKEDFPIEKVFNCSVIITPQDRPEPIASFARISVTITDARYVRLENPYISNNWVVLGQFSEHTAYLDTLGWHWLHQVTAFKDPGNIKELRVESYAGRHGFWQSAGNTQQSQGQL